MKNRIPGHINELILDNVRFGLSLITPDGRLIAINKTLAKIFRFESPQEMVDSIKSIDNDSYFDPEEIKTCLKLIGEKGKLDNFKLKAKRKDKTLCWLSVNSRAIRDEKEKAIYIVSTFEKIEDLISVEKKDGINDLIYQILLDLYQMLGEPLEKIISFVAEKCMDITESKTAYIGFINEDGFLKHIVLLPKDTCRQCNVKERISGLNIKTGGLWAEAARKKQSFIINDYDSPDLSKRGMPEGHIRIKRFMSIPVVYRDRVVLLGCFANKEEPYDEKDEAHARLLMQGLWNFFEMENMQKNLRESELRYRSLFENANDGIFLLKEDRFIDCNSKALEIFKCKKEDIIGKTPYEFSPPKQPDGKNSNEKAIEKIKEALKGNPQYFEWVHRTFDGEDFYTEVSLNALKIGKETFVQAIVRDITERKKAETQLMYERERYSFLVDRVPYGMVLIDETGKFLYVNKEWVALFGYTLDEIPDGISWLKKAYPDDDYRKMVIETWKQDMKDIQIGKKVPRIFNVTCKDGSIKVINFNTVLVEYNLIITTAFDITDYKRTEEQFLQAQKMEAIGRLAGGVAHDFNNMLTVILGHANLGMLELDLGHPLYQRFKEIKKAGERSSELTKNLLAFARKQTIDPKVLNLNSAIKDMLKMLMRLIGENIELKWIPGKDLWQTKFDPVQLTQVVMNLVVNAKDAIADVGRITIETKNIILDEAYCKNHLGFYPGEYVMLAISDNGIGMTKDILEHIFEPFYTTKEKEKGSGLGLSTVYGIVKQNNGFINAYSEPKKGTTFKIYLPRYVGKEEVHIIAETEAYPQSKGETILIVEDEKDVLELCVSMLEELGYRVISASTPFEAINKFKMHKDEIDLLITDVIMPEMNGKELSKMLLSIKPDLKCIFMSGYTNNAIIHNGIIESGISYLQKPFTLHELSSKVRETIEK
ncbi:MAG TPA: PAS domain S-box protein [Syntrophorhabdaceae bacterium]|nr:PAS domain S-box protein [Syntrophorhabdaceae bacterium]